MSLTSKARKRLALLGAVLSTFLVLGVSVWFVQQYLRDARASQMRAEGMAAIEKGDFQSAVTKLGSASARFPNDVELLLAFADARGRVESPFGNHLQRSLDRYVLAVRLAKRQNLSDEILLEALLGRGRLERMFGQKTRLKDSALEILAIDSANPEAMEFLLQLSYQVGDYLPGEPDLVVRGSRTDLEWRDALRDAADGSSLRWALELLAVDPEDVSRLSIVVDLLTLGEAIALQQLRWGETIETTDQLLDQWAEAVPSRIHAVSVLKAQGYLRNQDLERARGVLLGLEWESIEDPAVLVGAASMLYALGAVDDQARASELLSKAEAMVADDPESLVGIARRYWMSGRTQDARALLDEAVDARILNGKTGVDALSLLLLSMPELPDAAEFEEIISGIDLASMDLGDRERLRMIREITELLREDPFDGVRTKEFLASSMNWRGDLFIATLLGDLVRRANLPGVAADFYRDAIEAGREYASPLSFRLAESYLANGDPASSFTTAVTLAGYSPSLPNLLLVARAWIAMESLGIDAQQVAPGLSLRFDSPRELLEALQTSVDESESDVRFAIISLLVAAAATEEDTEFAVAELDRLIAGSTNERQLARLFGIGNRYQIPISSDTIAKTKTRTSDASLQEAIFAYELNALKRIGDRSSTLRWVGRELDARPTDMARRAVAAELLDKPDSSEEDLRRAYDVLAECSGNENDLRRMMQLSELLGDEDLGSEVIDLALERFGASSNPYCFVKAMYILAFHRSDDPESRRLVNEGRGELDDLVGSGMASIDVYLMLARLWYDIDSSSSEEAITILERAIERQPDHVPCSIYLARCLQESQRPDEADSVIQRLYRNRERFTPAQRTMLAGLLVRQGRDAEFAASICEVADRTGSIEDLLSCMEARRNNGEIAVADAILDRLAIRPDRSVAVEEAVARRRLRRGQIEEAIEGIEQSEIFQSEAVRGRLLANLLMNTGRWEEAATRLEVLVGSSEEKPGVSELMLAICLLNLEGSVERDARALDLMDAVVEANPTSTGMIRRVATTVASSTRVSDRGSKYIDILRELDIDQAELLGLGLEFGNLGGASVPEGFIARANALTERLDIPLAWSLHLDILAAAFRDAAKRGDFDSIQRLSEQLDAVSFDFTKSYSGTFGPLNRRVRALLLIGEVENARLVAFESIASIEESLELRDVILLARIDALLGRYEAVAELLEPFRDEILAAPSDHRFSIRLLLQVALHLGDVDQAMRIHDLGVQAGMFDGKLVNLMRICEKVEPEVAIRVARIAKSRLADPRDRFGLIGMLQVTRVRTGDDSVLMEINDILTTLREQSSSDALLGFQVDCLEVEVLANEDPIRSLERCVEIIRNIPSEVRARIRDYQRLTEAERNQIVAYAFPIAILANNLVARVADLQIEGGDESGITPEILEGCETANEILISILPEDANVLDSRARFLASMGETTEALALIDRALVGEPLNPEFRLTRAEIFSLAGDDASAVEAAREARVARRIGAPSDQRMAEEIEALITRLR